jgi:hypothetical protein
MGKEDLRFLIETFGERVVPDEGFEELWAWMTTAPHDTLFARAPLDETLLGLASPTAGWEVGRRTVEGMVEYFATLRVERGAWSGLSITVSHFEGTSDGDRVLFSASVGRLVDGSPECRQARVERLLRLCGLTDCKAGSAGGDLIGRSSTLADSGEFCLFCG